MKYLATAAIIAAASLGLSAQEQDQDQMLLQRFMAVQPQLEKHLAALQHKEAIKLLEDMLPNPIPEVEKNPEDPRVLMASLAEASAIQNMFVYMGRAQVLSGEIEKAIDSFKKANDIAEVKAVETEGLVNSQIQAWTRAVEQAEVRRKEIEEILARKDALEKEIEGKRKLKTSREKIKEIDNINKDMPNLENQLKVCNQTIQSGPSAIKQMNESLAREKEDAGRFAPVVASLQESIKIEQEFISSNFGGDKSKYVTSVVNTKENLESQKTKQDKVSFLNRLLLLDPANKDVQQQLALLIGSN